MHTTETNVTVWEIFFYYLISIFDYYKKSGDVLVTTDGTDKYLQM